MVHDPEVCNRVAEAVGRVTVAELVGAKKTGFLDVEAFCHGLARGTGLALASALIGGNVPKMVRQAAIMATLQLAYDATTSELAKLQEPSAGDLAATPPQGRA